MVVLGGVSLGRYFGQSKPSRELVAKVCEEAKEELELQLHRSLREELLEELRDEMRSRVMCSIQARNL
ncbi:hypothetical protein QN277_011739 [Acacia crassicarpa]|uniref:Uncharacterized protein n=1 Tax=Acacia crassicarpa TaxID=499986 RepID=A0AAE1MZT9_9FABA|nr:hypothetical protein QN277_011739 [Acacia crassicarpa]